MTAGRHPECWMCGDSNVSDPLDLDERGRCRDRSACDARTARLAVLGRVIGLGAPLRSPVRGYRQDAMTGKFVTTDLAFVWLVRGCYVL